MGAPPAAAVFAMYVAVGSALSFGLGRRPGALPEDFAAELWLPAAVLCLVLILYSVIDVMTAGLTAQKHPKPDKPGGPEAEEVHLARRAQMNQVEQLPGFIVAMAMFSLFVNGPAAGLLGAVWGVLRQLYTATYRASVGVPMEKKGLTTYTIPCYFILNGMSMAAVVHLLRYAALRYQVISP